MFSCSSATVCQFIDTLPFTFFAFNPTPIAPENYPKIVDLLSKTVPLLTSNHIPELLFLQRKAIQLNGIAVPLLKTLHSLIDELRLKKQTDDDADLLEKMSQLSLKHSHTQVPKEKEGIERHILETIRHLMHQKEERSPALAKLTLLCEPFLTKHTKIASWTIFTKVLRIAEIFFQQSNTTSAAAIGFEEKLLMHNIDPAALLQSYNSQKEYKHLEPIQPYLLMCALSYGIVPPNNPKELGHVLKNHLWQELLVGKSEVKTFRVPPQFQQSCTITIEPLTLAIMLDDLLLIGALIANGASHQTPDAHGYTPAHMAALFCNYPALLFFHRLGADFSATCPTGATVYNILHSLGFEHSNKNAAQSTQDAARVHQYKVLTKKTYCFRSLFSMPALFRLWFSRATETDLANITIIEQYVFDQYRRLSSSHTPPVFLQKTAHGFELCASRLIRAGELIIDLTGKVVTIDEIPPESKTIMFDIQNNLCLSAADMGSSAEYITQGPPNCAFFQIIRKGCFHQFLYAIRDISPNERIQYNSGRDFYDAHHKSFVETNPTSVELFLKGSQNLATFPFKLTRVNDKWHLEFVAVEKSQPHYKKIEIRDISYKALIDIAVTAHYTRAMMAYLIDFPEYPLQLIQKGTMRPATFLSFLDAYRASRLPQHHDETRYIELFIRIVQSAPWKSLQPTTVAKK